MNISRALFSTAFSGLLLLGSAFAVRAQPAAPPDTSPVALTFKLSAGFTYDTSVTMDVRRIVQVKGSSPAPLHERTVFVTRSQVLDVSSEGVMNIENEFRALKLRQESGDTLLFDYDSARARNITVNDSAASLARVYAPLIGSKYRARVAADGTVLEVSGVTEMIANVLDALSREGVSTAEVSRVRTDFEQAFGGERLSEHFYSVSELPPATPVRIGEPWTRRFLSGDPDLPLVVRSTGTVAGRDGDDIIIYERGDMALDEGATQLGKSPIPIETQFYGTHRGGTRLDLAHSRRTSRLQQRYLISFGYDVPVPGAKGKFKHQEVSIQGANNYLIEVNPVPTEPVVTP